MYTTNTLAFPALLIQGTITARSLEDAELRILEMTEDGLHRIWLMLDSHGGDTRSTMAFIQRLQEWQAQGVWFGAKIFRAASAAANIALTCDDRQIISTGTFALHPMGCVTIQGHEFDDGFKFGPHIQKAIQTGWESGRLTHELLSRHKVRLTTQMNARLAAANTLDLNAQQCLETGIVSRITV